MSPPQTSASLPLASANQKLLQASVRLQANALKSITLYQMEGLSFLKCRFEADAKLLEDLADTYEFNDAFDIVTNFMQSAANDYMAEVARVASIGSKVASETAQWAQKEVRNATEHAATATTI